jgi:hypothetical protein
MGTQKSTRATRRSPAAMQSVAEQAPERSLEQIKSEQEVLFGRMRELGAELAVHSSKAAEREANAQAKRLQDVRKAAGAEVPEPEAPRNPLICDHSFGTSDYVGKVLRFLERLKLTDENASEDAEFGRQLVQEWVADAQEYGVEQAEREREIDRRVIEALQGLSASADKEAQP